MRRFLIVFIILQTSLVFSQNIVTPIPVPFSVEDADDIDDDWTPKNNDDYKPYDKDEFSQWMKDLRRAEIIAFGTLPFSLFLASLGYEVGEYVHSGFSDSYIPMFRDATSAARIKQFDNRTETILAITAGLSIGFALVDYALGLMEEE